MVKLGKNLRGMLQPFLLTVFERKSDHARDSAPADDAGSAEVDLIQAVIPCIMVDTVSTLCSSPRIARVIRTIAMPIP